jgi:signal transduction histidine kinase
VSAGEVPAAAAVPRAISGALAPLPEAHLVTGLDGTVGFASPAAERLLDTDHGGLAGRGLSDLLAEPPTLAPILGRWSRTTSLRPAPLQLADGRQLRCDGARLAGHALLLVRLRERGDALTAFEQVNDRLDTANLRALSRRLEASVAELRDSNLQLAAANEEVQQYARAVAHDVRTPLFTIQAFARLLAEDGHVDEPGAEHVRSILDSTARLQQITDALLEVARLDRTGPTGGRSDLAAALDDVLADLAAEVDPVAVAMTAGPLHPVAVESSALRRVLQNLVVNALRHAAVPGRRLHISVTSTRVGDDVTVAVRDDGAGVDDRDRDRIFDLFHRGAGAAETPGTGIGLAACRKIITAWGGTITCEPAPDTGTCFVFTAPAAHGPARSPERVAPPGPGSAPTG